MRYVYTCADCGDTKTVDRPVAERDEPILCMHTVADPVAGWVPCGGLKVRDYRGQLRSIKVTCPTYFCDSTRSDFEPSHAEAAAYDKRMETMGTPKKGGAKAYFDKVRQEVGA